MVKASVIVPVHNAEKTLRKCVESLVFGAERAIEILLVEDHSQDDSWKLCLALEQEFSQVYTYRNTDGSGVSSTRNLGLEKAAGEFILFVDSDDWVSGRYADALLKAAAENRSSFVLCGYHFLDGPAERRTRYLLKDCAEVGVLQRADFFALYHAVLIQQLWNKVFLRSVIVENGIRFDERLSMGEDYQFVLDYLAASQVDECRVLNQPLYYYVRGNNTSLMSKFGAGEGTRDFSRLKQLLRFCGEDDPRAEKQYQRAVSSAEKNSVYQTCRLPGMTRAEKLRIIDSILHDGQAERHYRAQQRLILKERLWRTKKRLIKLAERVSGRVLRWKRDRLLRKVKNEARFDEISVISQNCIGGVFYHDMGKRFLSPTVNLFFMEPDFVRFANDLQKYMSLEMQMCWGEEYPIGLLGDVRVYFMHYSSCTEAKETWERRKQRIRWDRILVLASDMEGFDEACYRQWEKISYPKVLFSNKNWGGPGCVFYPEYQGRASVPDLIPRREFYRDGLLLETANRI